MRKAISNIKGGVKIADIGHLMETGTRKHGFKVIKNLGGHGIGRSPHEEPAMIKDSKRTLSLLLKPSFQLHRHMP